MQISDEDLIAYLLGDASGELRRSIELQVATDLDLQRRLSELRQVLGQLDSVSSVYEPPADLVDSTLAFIDENAEQPVQLASSSLSPAHSTPRRRTSYWDSPALSLSIIAMCCLILPTVVRARYESRRLQCANNFRVLGQHFTNYAQQSGQGRIPAIPLSGRASFAGFYRVGLAEAGIPVPASLLQCASRIGIDDADAADIRDMPRITHRGELELLTEEELELFQQHAGGDFAYSLGLQVAGQVVAPQQQSQSQLVISADSPVFDGSQERFVAHAGRGLNVLFLDGRVIFLDIDFFYQPDAPGSPKTSLNDDPFRNLRGTHEVGLSPQDASLAPSHFPPIAR